MRPEPPQPRRIFGPRLAIGIIAIIGVVTLGGVVLTQVATAIPVRHLLSDPWALVSLPIYAGLISNLGVLGWAAATAICLFSFIVIDPGRGQERLFLLRAALLSGFLCLDDLFGLHERALPRLGVPELVVYGFIGAAALTHFALSLAPIRRSQWWILAVAMAFFAFSLFVEVLVHEPPEESLLRVAEEGGKFMGIVAWLLYHTDTGARFLSLDPGDSTTAAT